MDLGFKGFRGLGFRDEVHDCVHKSYPEPSYAVSSSYCDGIFARDPHSAK